MQGRAPLQPVQVLVIPVLVNLTIMSDEEEMTGTAVLRKIGIL